ncbi:hypothetical protein BC941DRAFT_371942 [Chlamydoabsidia padenii]|nr:hypothetical protein BC941DRAFT_371942 [Chlamydoabsidia padenii]
MDVALQSNSTSLSSYESLKRDIFLLIIQLVQTGVVFIMLMKRACHLNNR